MSVQLLSKNIQYLLMIMIFLLLLLISEPDNVVLVYLAVLYLSLLCFAVCLPCINIALLFINLPGDKIMLGYIKSTLHVYSHINLFITNIYWNIPFLSIYSLICLLCGDIELNPGPDNEYCDISICHLNIRILSSAKLSAIRNQLAGVFGIITISETWLGPNTKHKLDIPGYQTIFRRDRNNDGGGVAAYVANNIGAKRRQDLESVDIEAMWLEVRAKNNKFLLSVCYRPPDDHVEFWTNIQHIVDNAKAETCKNILLTGDLNADPLADDGPKLSTFANLLMGHPFDNDSKWLNSIVIYSKNSFFYGPPPFF